MPADSKEALSMTPLVLASLALAAMFFGAWYGIPMWMTFKRPERGPDFSEARAYLQATAGLADDGHPPAHHRDPRDRAGPSARRGGAGQAQPPGGDAAGHPRLRVRPEVSGTGQGEGLTVLAVTRVRPRRGWQPGAGRAWPVSAPARH